MENAVDALKIAFAVMVLVLALTVSIICFNMAKSTSDFILYTKDETNYYTYQGATGENRIVGLETIIPTLYRYYKENYTIVFKQGNYDETTGELTNVSFLNVYTTPAKIDEVSLGVPNYEQYKNTFWNKYRIAENKISTNIFSFDLSEEILRGEPWTGSADKTKSYLDAFLNGSEYRNPIDNSAYKDFGNDSNLKKKGFIELYKISRFVETISEYKYEANEDETENTNFSSLTKDKTKRIITYTLIK